MPFLPPTNSVKVLKAKALKAAVIKWYRLKSVQVGVKEKARSTVGKIISLE